MSNMKYYKIQAYKKRLKNGHDFVMYDIVLVTLKAEDEKEALSKARDMIKRKYYRVSEVIEINDEHEKLHEDSQMLSLEMQAKMLKLMEG